MLNLTIFFSEVRKFLRLAKQSQVDGLRTLVMLAGADDRYTDVRFVAYLLATIAWETASTFEPIVERRARMGTRAWFAQKKYWSSGFFGRGFIQLTWLANYALWTKLLGVDLVNHPELAQRPDIAFRIAAQGMIEGRFRHFKLSDYITARGTDYLHARNIINSGLDKANEIARLAVGFEKALRLACYSHNAHAVTLPALPATTGATVVRSTEAPAPVITSTPQLTVNPSTNANSERTFDSMSNNTLGLRATQTTATEISAKPGIRTTEFWFAIGALLLTQFGDAINAFVTGHQGGAHGSLYSAAKLVLPVVMAAAYHYLRNDQKTKALSASGIVNELVDVAAHEIVPAFFNQGTPGASPAPQYTGPVGIVASPGPQQLDATDGAAS